MTEDFKGPKGGPEYRGPSGTDSVLSRLSDNSDLLDPVPENTKVSHVPTTPTPDQPENAESEQVVRSAYEIAKEADPSIGTEEEWKAGIGGEPGSAGTTPTNNGTPTIQLDEELEDDSYQAPANTDSSSQDFGEHHSSASIADVSLDTILKDPASNRVPEDFVPPVVEDGVEAISDDDNPEPGHVNYGGIPYYLPSLVTYMAKSGTVTQQRPYSSQRPYSDSEESMAVTNISPEDTALLVADLTKEELEQSEQAALWYNVLMHSSYPRPMEDSQERRLAKPGSDFHQGYKTDRALLLLRNLRPNSNNTSTEGEVARMRVLDAFNISGRGEFFLPSSGFWIKLTRPADAEINNVWERINEESMEIAKSTYGRSYANRRSLLLGHIIDFIFDHVIEVSVETGGMGVREFLYEETYYDDVDTLVWAIGTLIWPDGWQYLRSVAGDKNDKFKVIRQVFDLRGLMHLDNAAFTQSQIEYISDRRGKKHTREELNKYRSEFKRKNMTVVDPKEADIKLRADIRFIIRTPKIKEVLTAADAWIRTIAKTWEEAAVINDSVRNRDRYINSQVRATRLRNYEQWISSIELGTEEEPNSIVDRQTISETLRDLSSETRLFSLIEGKVSEHLVDNLLYVVGIPVIDKKFGEETLPNNPYLIPLDTVSAFFIKLRSRVNSFVTP